MDRRYETDEDRYGRGYDYERGRERGGQRYGGSYGYGAERRDYEGGDVSRDFGERGSGERGFGGRGLGREGYGGGRSYGFGGYSNERFERDDERDYGRGYERNYGGGYGGRDYERGFGSGSYGFGGRGYGRGDERNYGYDPDYGLKLGRNYRPAQDFYGEDRGYDRERYSSRGYDYEERDERGWGGHAGRGERGWWDRTRDEVASWFGDEGAERRRRRDEVRAESYRGRGPRGYRRSDSRIEEDVNDRLSDYPFLDASDIEVEVENGEVTLSGAVSSRRDKRLAEDIAESVSGVTNVENRIRVRREGWGTTTGTSGTTGTALGAAAGASGATGTAGTTGGTTGARGTDTAGGGRAGSRT